jgi:hypothetical protein
MKKLASFGYALAAIALLFAVLACNLVSGSADPTEVPVSVPEEMPDPNAAPVQVEEPAEVPTEVPTEVPPEPEIIEETSAVPAGELGVSTIMGYQDEWETWIIVGLVMNNTDRAVDDVEVEVEVLDSAGSSLYQEVAYSTLYSLAPGESAPFVLWVYDDLPDVSEFVGTIVGFSATDLERAEVEISGTMMTFGGGYVNVTGQLVNNNDYPVEIDDLAVATFNGAGQLMTADSDDVLIGYLKPGEAGPFRVSMDAPGVGQGEIVDFTVYANAEVSDGEDTFEINLLEESGYFDSDGDYHLVGELMNDSAYNLNISLMAAFYDVDGNVLDVSYGDIPTFAVAPGETIVFDAYNWTAYDDTEGVADQAVRDVIQVDYSWTYETDITYTDLPVTDGGFEESFWGLNFKGQVTNNAASLVDGGKIIVVLRDKATGGLIATGYETLWDDIPTGGSYDYDVLVEIAEGFDTTSFDYTVVVLGTLE